jgi:hypothetical protein
MSKTEKDAILAMGGDPLDQRHSERTAENPPRHFAPPIGD